MSFAIVLGYNWLSNARHLRVWRTDAELKNGGTIYVAMANANDGYKFRIIPKISPDLDTQREQLFQQLDLSTTGITSKGLSNVFGYNQVHSRTLPESHAEILLVADFYNGASCYPALNVVIEKIRNFLKFHGTPGNDIQCGRLEVSSQP